MKFLLALFLALFVAVTIASGNDRKAVVVSYDSDTPDSVIEEAKNTIKAGGGMITHEYHLIKAFAAQAGEQALDIVQTYGAKYNALIEDDTQMHANGA